MFAHLYQRVDDTAIEQAKITRIAGNIDRGNTRHELVKGCGGQQFEFRLALAHAALGINHFCTVLPTRD